MTIPGELAQTRFRELLEALGSERSFAHGWKREIADAVGISPSHLSRVMAGERQVSLRVLTRAAERFGFNEAYYATDSGGYPQFPRDERPPDLDRMILEVGGSKREAMVRLVAEIMDGWHEHRTVDATAATVLARLVAEHPAVAAAQEVLRAKTPGTRARKAYVLAMELEGLLIEGMDTP